jgi:hypothetical protein
MAITDTIKENASRPAPKWYRKTSSILHLLGGPTILSIIKIFNLAPATQSNILELFACLPTLLEILRIALANGEVYAPAELTDEQLQDHLQKKGIDVSVADLKKQSGQ